MFLFSFCFEHCSFTITVNVHYKLIIVNVKKITINYTLVTEKKKKLLLDIRLLL